MGYFYKGVHYSHSSKLGPNEGLGEEDEMSFQKLANQIEERKKENNNIVKQKINVNNELNEFDFYDDILEKILLSNMDYKDLHNYTEKLSKFISILHEDCLCNIYPSSVTQCILECYKRKFNYLSNIWYSQRDLDNLNLNIEKKPIKFSRMNSQGELLKYTLYNKDIIDEYTQHEEKDNNDYSLDDYDEELFSDNKFKYYLLCALKYERISSCRDFEIFACRYGYVTKHKMTLEDVAGFFNITRERVRQICVRMVKRMKTRMRFSKNKTYQYWQNFEKELNLIIEKILIHSSNNLIDKKQVKEIFGEEYNATLQLFLDLINDLSNNNFQIESEQINHTAVVDENKQIKKAILACIREFSNLYGKSGIAKILKGSKGLKENGYNSKVFESDYYGAFNQLTLAFIENEIEDLIQDKYLDIKKVSFGRPLLGINQKGEEYIQSKTCEQINIRTTKDADPILLTILDLIKQKQNIFITGHAGTGKSYLLNKLKEHLGKQLTITSTTGIAAVNVKGQTLHSWAGVGICNFPISYVVERILSKSKIKNQIKYCKILAIDEVSMLNIETFEYVDKVLRLVREVDLPFGGIQLIMIGDFFQLPPVDKEKSSTLTEKKYCFESNLWDSLNLKNIVLKQNYRQNEENFIQVLSNMRVNKLTDADVKLLKTREFNDVLDVHNILHIYATNEEADNYNIRMFNSIDSKEYNLISFDGIYKGEKLVTNPECTRDEILLKRIDVTCRAEKSISLKINARVMLLINLDFKKGLINGSCGTVLEIDDNSILVQFDNGVVEKITKHDFEFYSNDKLIAIRRQYPLRLAYGITIHKSQGMSLDSLVVDCSRIFEKGQTYVALSRIKTLEGLYLLHFAPEKVKVDQKVANFYKTLVETPIKTDFSSEELDQETSDHIEEDCNKLELLEDFKNKIRNIILERNTWIEVYEIAKIMGVNRHTSLVKNDHNTTIAHIINRFLKREGFISKRITFENGGYSIVVAPPNTSIDTIPKAMYHKNNGKFKQD